MSNGTGGNGCVEVVYNFDRHGEWYWLLDTKDNDRSNPEAGLVGPLAVYSAQEYAERLEKVELSGDARAMFDAPEQYKSLNPTEMAALAAYTEAGVLAVKNFIDAGHSVIARESMSDLPEELRARHMEQATLYAS